jgi:glutamine synthetase
MVVGLEVEFHVFDLIDRQLDHAAATMPGQPPLTRNLSQGYQFLTGTRYGEVEDVMDELRRACEAMRLPVRSLEVEMGPSQFEFTFDPGAPLDQADNMLAFRALAKEVCAGLGLHATFMCRPRVENGAASGWHLHQSLLDATTGVNCFMPSTGDKPTPKAGQWIAGLMERAAESCLLTTPTVNGYKRYDKFQLAPDRIQWGRDNRGAMIRALFRENDAASRIENRVAETAANPYYLFASQILSGMDGVNRNLTADAASDTPYEGDAAVLPRNLGTALELFDRSDFYRSQVGDEFVDYLVRIKRAEWERYLSAVSEWEQAEYFSLY